MTEEKHEEEALHGFEKLRATRIEKMEALRASGVNPYPYRYAVTHSTNAVREGEKALAEAGTVVRVAGRVVALRGHGKTAFGHIEDATGRLQFYLKRDDVGKEIYRRFELVDLGDIVGVAGTVFRTRTDELTVKVESLDVLSKALRPLPGDWHGLADKEIRYRQRYVDLVVNPEVREVFVKRSRLVETMRRFLLGRGFLEVETPVLQPLYGGATARPFTTHHNALDMTLYLRIANELYLKRLLVGGFDRVFEFAKDFRNEGIDRSHNPEFTMMECYAANLDYMDFMDMTEAMVAAIARELTADGKASFDGHLMDFSKPWRRVRFFDALREKTGVEFFGLSDGDAAATRSWACVEKGSPASVVINEVFGARVEPDLLEPTFIYDYQGARRWPGPPLGGGAGRAFRGLHRRLRGVQCVLGLNDPLEQRRRFEQQMENKARGDEEAHLSTKTIYALSTVCPRRPDSGSASTVTMVFTDNHSIRDVILFPHMRPEDGR
jgi:lysyl-tRNA synthetase class 2